jgi:hypothetical protein
MTLGPMIEDYEVSEINRTQHQIQPTYGAISYSKERKEHVIIAAWHQLADHRLGVLS